MRDRAPASRHLGVKIISTIAGERDSPSDADPPTLSSDNIGRTSRGSTLVYGTDPNSGYSPVLWARFENVNVRRVAAIQQRELPVSPNPTGSVQWCGGQQSATHDELQRRGLLLVDVDVQIMIDRAAARDFADVRLLARRFGKDVLLARAAQIDAALISGPWLG